MKKNIIALCISLSSLLSPLSSQKAVADEGMWTLYNLPSQVFAQMQQEGFSLPSTALYSDANAIKNCVVNFSGYCSGVVVSPDGLVFTNHHCGFEAIRSHATVEHDYMLNGFYAKSYEEELPNENMFVSFMRSQEDITCRLQAEAKKRNIADDDMSALIDSLQQAMTDSVKLIDKTLHVEIDPFYEGNSYYATVYQQFRDLRVRQGRKIRHFRQGGGNQQQAYQQAADEPTKKACYPHEKTTFHVVVFSKDNRRGWIHCPLWLTKAICFPFLLNPYCRHYILDIILDFISAYSFSSINPSSSISLAFRISSRLAGFSFSAGGTSTATSGVSAASAVSSASALAHSSSISRMSFWISISL